MCCVYCVAVYSRFRRCLHLHLLKMRGEGRLRVPYLLYTALNMYHMLTNEMEKNTNANKHT